MVGKEDKRLLGKSMDITRLIVSVVLTGICIIALTACGTSTPSRGLAPSKQLVQKAIALQVSQTQEQLTEQLQASPPNFEIARVALKQLEPLFLDGLPTYHILGTYNLKIQLPQQVTQQKNSFDIYLQRQKQGKTWRLAIPEDKGESAKATWRTYLIPFDS
jgi:hypothetical protein